MAKTSMLDSEAMIKLLAVVIGEAGGTQKAWCQQHDVSTSYVSDVLAGRAEPGKKILDAIGYERVTMYRKSLETKS